MNRRDPEAERQELEQLRAGVSCAVLLEKAGWKLDQRESSRANMKYRRGEGEIVIVNHDGRGWWDPGSQAKGDVFKLAQHLDRQLNFGQVRRRLRELVGLAPSYPAAERAPKDKAPALPHGQRWTAHRPVSPGSPTWTYLTVERGLTPEVVLAATRADALREGPYASAWFAHRDGEGALTGIEMRGPNYRGFSADGDKSLFRLQPGTEPPSRLAVLEAPIKAMGLAALEGLRTDTLYVGTAGGMGPLTVACLKQEMAALAKHPGAVLVAATDADLAGDRYAARLAELAAEVALPVERKAPVGHKDWDLVLKARGAAPARSARPRTSSALEAVVKAMQPSPPTTPMPWAASPVSLAERIRAYEERDALRAAEAMAAKGRAGTPANPQPEGPRQPSPGYGSTP